MLVTILAAFLGSEIGRRGQQGQVVQGAATKSLWASDASCGKDTSGSSSSKRFGTERSSHSQSLIPSPILLVLDSFGCKQTHPPAFFLPSVFLLFSAQTAFNQQHC